jgi:hypothetical protein
MVRFPIRDHPWPTTPFRVECPTIIWVVVLQHSPTQVFRLPDIGFARRSADNHVCKESVGDHYLEPTIRRGELTADRSIRRGESYSGIRGGESASKSGNECLVKVATLDLPAIPPSLLNPFPAPSGFQEGVSFCVFSHEASRLAAILSKKVA